MTDATAAGQTLPDANRIPAGQVLDATRGDYHTDGPSLFWLSMRQVFLAVITLGIYRFWMTTNLRRHYWRAVRVLGDPFEYSGTGLEKLLGFLIAVIILAVYLGVFNLALTFGGLLSLDDPIELQVLTWLSFVASLPLIYFATYRARRYILARTRWRGIRFGMEQAAWKYTWRALLLTLLSIVTVGLMYPYQHFKLEKFKTDRTWFGDLSFEQGGSWVQLFRYWVWFYVIVAIIAAAIAGAVASPESASARTLAIVAGIFGYIAIFIVGIRYQVAAFRYLWGHRTLGGARFSNDIDTGEVIGVYIGGSIATGICAALVGTAILSVLGGLAYFLIGQDTLTALLSNFPAEDGADGDPNSVYSAGYWAGILGVVVGYITIGAAAFAFAQIFITRPILRRKAEGMQIYNVSALAESRQRGHDDARDAGGFADALGVDVGAGF
ncbi:MAG: DUF898 family protein [Pseudomonadota bacterium]